MQNSYHFKSSIPRLDVALGHELCPGNLILVAGLQGGGKTILAAQLSRDCAVGDRDVLFLSTEVTPEALYKRQLAAVCSIPFDQVKDGVATVAIPGAGGVQLNMPDPAVYGEDAVRTAHPVLNALARHFTFLKFKPEGYDPRQEFDAVLTTYREENKSAPDVLIYDYLKYPCIDQADMDPYRMREAVVAASQALKDLAVEHQMLVIVFCQVDPNLVDRKKIDPAGMLEFKKVWEHADAFVGISQRLRDETSTDLARGLYERIQHLNVTTKNPSRSVLVPVERVFEYQRFDPCRWRPREKPEDMDELDRRARVIERTSEFPGYVLARRKALVKLFDIGSPHAINLYAFLLLVTKSDGPETGWSFYSRKVQTDMLGLSSKQLIAATFVLDGYDFIEVPEGKKRESLRYRVVDWNADQNPKTEGYFKLFRNLRDTGRADLMADATIFRLWLYLLTEARAFPDEPQELAPGEVLLKPRRIQEALQLNPLELDAAIERLQARGSIACNTAGSNKLTITNWHLYQKKVWGSTDASATDIAAE